MKNADGEACSAVWCGMLVYGKYCGIGQTPEKCETARGVKQPTAYELELEGVGRHA